MKLGRVVVVGAALAGGRAAEALRRAGFDGELTVVGAEEHRPYQRPPLSKQLLAGAWERSQVDLRLSSLDADLRLGTVAEGLDAGAREVVVRDREGRGERIAFDGLVIATGCRPRSLPGAPGPAEMEGVHTLRTVDDCLALRAELDANPTVAIVGAGFIGSEVAATCRTRGLEVTLIDPLDAPLQRALGQRIGEVVRALHREHGVDLKLGAGVVGLDGDGHVTGVRLDDDTSVAADVVVLGVGVTPAVEWLQGSGVRLDDGVVCDARCMVEGMSRVVAAGDVARWFHERSGRHRRVEHFDNAAAQAVAAARALLAGDAAEPYDPVLSFWSDQYDVKLQLLGLPDPGDALEIVEGDVSTFEFIAAYGRAGRTVAVLGANCAKRLHAYRDAVARQVAFPPRID